MTPRGIRHAISRILPALLITGATVLVAEDVAGAVDYRLEMITGTFTARINERLIFTVSPPRDGAVESMLTDPSSTALVQLSSPLMARSDVMNIVAGQPFTSESETAIAGPLFQTISLNDGAAYQLLIRTSDTARRDGSLRIARDGLRALRVTLTAPSGLVAELTTFVNVVSARSVATLPVSFIASADGAPSLQPDGTITVASTVQETLRDLRDVLFRKPPGVPIGVRIRPEVLDGLSRSTAETDRALFTELATKLPDNDVLVATFRPTDVASYAAADQKSAFDAQLLRGESVLDAVNGPRLPSRAIWISDAPIDAAGVDLLRTFGVTNVVMLPDAVGAYGVDTNPSRPYALRSASNGVVLHLADSRYATLLDVPTGTAHESATALAAEVIAQRNEIASSSVGASALAARHVVIASASGVPAEPLIASILLRHLRNAPQIELRRLGDFAPTLEGLARIDPPVVPKLDIATIQRRTNDALASVESVRDVIATNDGVADRWVELIDVANDTTITESERDAYIDGVLARVAAVRNAVALPERSFTFGSRESELRIPLLNQSEFTVSLRLQLASPTGKMSFAPSSLDVTLPAGEQREIIINATARANGLIPVELSLLSPAGVVMDVAEVRIRMNALAGLGRGVSLVFLVLLLAWWIIHARRAHRKKTTRQHPALRSQA